MKKIIVFCLFFYFSHNLSYAQQNYSSSPSDIGISFNLLGPLFGEYNVGLSAFLNAYIQAGISTTYFATQYVSPQVNGWQTELRGNYFFANHYRSGFYIGLGGGVEFVDVKKESASGWEQYNDLTWSVTPGYAWVVGRSFTTMLGLHYGYNLGEIQISPEIGIFILL